ncbi:MAG: DUF4932 domain-containing protein [Candidatus Aminicenantes bacterium]|nr:DUF4932 domain-containing protein [Candidatus Aminicenantes bacterium]
MKIQERAGHLLWGIAGLLFLTNIGAGASLERQVGPKAYIAYPKNLALVHILVLLTPSRWERPDLFNNPLVQTARDYFKDVRDHPAVALTDRIFNESWYSLLNALAIMHSDWPDAKLVSGLVLPDEIQKYPDLGKTISAYVEAVRGFYADSKFQAFWDSHQNEFSSLTQELAGGFQKTMASPLDPQARIPPVDIPDVMEKFYGESAARYTLIPCPFMQNSATHFEVRRESGESDFYYFMGGDFFRNPFYTTYFAFHEFGHSFVEPVAARYRESIAWLSPLFSPLEESMRRLGYGSWDLTFNEHLIRAGGLLLTRKAFGEAVMLRMKDAEGNPEFKMIDHFVDSLKEYERRRDQYPNLESFFPEILKKLGRLKIGYFRRPDRMGFVAQWQDEAVTIRDVVPNSVPALAGLQKGDALLSIQSDPITSLDALNEARQKWWVGAKEGDSVELVVRRADGEHRLRLTVPFIADFRYVEGMK